MGVLIEKKIDGQVPLNGFYVGSWFFILRVPWHNYTLYDSPLMWSPVQTDGTL